MKAREIMTRDPITTLPQTTIEDLCELLRRENINGTPVVDESGRLVGIVSQDLVLANTVHVGGFQWTSNLTTIDLIAASTNAESW